MGPPVGICCRWVQPWANLLLILLFGLPPPSALAIAILPHRDAVSTAPCTIFLFEDGHGIGCDDIQPGTPEGYLLAAVADHAIATMIAWRALRTGLPPDVEVSRGPPDSADSSSGRLEAPARLRAEVARTVRIDSLAAAIDWDSLSCATRVVTTRYWIARIVRLSGSEIARWRLQAPSFARAPVTRRQIDRISYRETWSPPPSTELLGIEEVESIELYPVTDRSAEDLAFPVRETGLSPAVTEPNLPVSPNQGHRDEAGNSGPAPEPSVINACGCEAPGVWVSSGAPRPQVPIPDHFDPPYGHPDLKGTVSLLTCIDIWGYAGCTRVLSDVPGLTEAALNTLRGWKFDPALDRYGNPVAMWLELPFRFVGEVEVKWVEPRR